MALDQKFFKKSTAATGLADQEQGLTVHIDANDVDSYDGDGTVWYDIAGHEVNIPIADKASNLQFELNFSNTSSYPGYGTTFTDVSGNGLMITPGTNSSATYTYGQDLGGYINIQANTTNETWTIPHSNDTHLSSTNGFTYEYWLYFDTTGNDTHQFYLKGTGASNYDTYFYLHESAGWYFQVGGISSHFIHNADKLLDQWVHVVFTMSTPTNPVQKLYINGSLVKTSTASGTVSNTSSYNTNIGSVLGNTNDIYGKIGCIRLYNTVLSGAEVGQNFRHGRNLSYSSIITSKHEATQSSLVTAPPTQGTLYTSNLAFHLDANGHSGTYWTDSANNINGTIDGATYVNDNNSDYFTFDGSNDTVTFPASDTSPINFSSETYAIEFWVNFNTLANDDVILGKFGGSNTTKSFQIQVSSTNKLTILERDGSSNNTFETTGTFSNGTWIHFIYARSASQVILYINGTLDSTHSASNAINAGSTQNITIGNQAGASVYFDGKLAQLRIYSSTLNSSQVLTNYNATKDLYQGITSLELHLDANGYSSGNWSDTSGNSRHATISGNTAHTNDNNSDYFTLDGTGDYFTVAHNNIFNLEVDNTIEMWIWRSSTTTEQTLMHKGESWSSGNAWFLNWTSGAGYYFYDYDTASLTKSGTAAAPLNEWTHLILSWNADTRKAKMYINGAEPSYHTAPTDGGGSVGATNTDALEIGKEGITGTGHPAWNGRIAQVRWYKGAMTESQARTNYNATKELYQNPSLALDFDPTDIDDSASTATWTDKVASLVLTESGTIDYNQELGDFANLEMADYFGNDSATTVIKDANGDFVMDFWVNFNSAMTSYHNVLLGVNQSSGTRGILFYFGSSGMELYIYKSGTMSGSMYGNPSWATLGISTERWYNLTVRVDASTNIKYFVDGQLKATLANSVGGTHWTAMHNIRLGDDATLSYNSNFKIGNFRIYKGLLTEAQITQNYLATKNKYPNDNSATINGSPTWSTNSNPAYNYFLTDASSEYFTIPDSPVFDLINEQSMELWIYRIGTGHGQYIIDKATNSSSNYGWQFLFSTGDKYYFQMHNAPYSDHTPNLNVASTVNTWEHIVVTCNGNKEWKLYKNGSLAATDNDISGNVARTTQVLTFGKYSLGSQAFNGRFGMIKFYDKTLSATEVTAAYNNTKGTYGIT